MSYVDGERVLMIENLTGFLMYLAIHKQNTRANTLMPTYWTSPNDASAVTVFRNNSIQIKYLRELSRFNGTFVDRVGESKTIDWPSYFKGER